MKVQLTRKLSEMVDGIDLSSVRVGDTFELPPRDALTLIAEGWALFVPNEGREAERDRAHDRPRRTRPARTRLNHTKR
jgi:hypothetical protein